MQSKTIEQRFMRDVMPEPNSGCWLWVGSLNDTDTGSGRFRFNHRILLAHRASYEIFRGAIDEGDVVTRKCGVGNCVNPDHLRATERRGQADMGSLLPFWAESQKALATRHDRFLRLMKKNKETGCWDWIGGLNRGDSGYPTFGKFVYAHRYSYEHYIGPIDERLEINHRCENTRCVNPDHLEAVTHLENVRYSHVVATACPQGHDFTHENTWVEKNGARHCRRCHREREAARRQRLKGVVAHGA